MEKKIKSFIYLDEEKMYSISSQLFEGLTEYILSDNKDSLEHNDTQKGSFASGRVMGEILTHQQGSSEKRFLHDYAYNLFENELLVRQLLDIVSDNEDIPQLSNTHFVKVTGKASFYDYLALSNTIKEFNGIGEALGYIQCFSIDGSEINQIKEVEFQTKDRNQKNKVNMTKSQLNAAFKKYLTENNLHIDDAFLKNVTKLYDFGYKDQFEVRIPYSQCNIEFASILNRTFLKENEVNLIRKYSRRSEIDFSIVGLLTQSGENKGCDVQISSEDNPMKKASIDLLNSISKVEDTFNGRFSNEIIIDPIAIYREF